MDTLSMLHRKRCGYSSRLSDIHTMGHNPNRGMGLMGRRDGPARHQNSLHLLWDEGPVWDSVVHALGERFPHGPLPLGIVDIERVGIGRNRIVELPSLPHIFFCDDIFPNNPIGFPDS